MYRRRIQYWSLSRLAAWLTEKAIGVKPPRSGTMSEWEAWEVEFKSKAPFTHWLVDTAFDAVQDVVCYPIDVFENAMAYARNRFGDKTHYLRTGLKPGQYQDLDTRLMNACFLSLVDFVEIEKASCALWDNEEVEKYLGMFKRTHWYNIFETPRCAEAGVSYLKWEALQCEKGQPSSQALNAMEILALYNWWTAERPSRVDPYNAEFENAHDLGEPMSDEYVEFLEGIDKKRREYSQEDTIMLCRLMQIRPTLTT